MPTPGGVPDSRPAHRELSAGWPGGGAGAGHWTADRGGWRCRGSARPPHGDPRSPPGCPALVGGRPAQ